MTGNKNPGLFLLSLWNCSGAILLQIRQIYSWWTIKWSFISKNIEYCLLKNLREESLPMYNCRFLNNINETLNCSFLCESHDVFPRLLHCGIRLSSVSEADARGFANLKELEIRKVEQRLTALTTTLLGFIRKCVCLCMCCSERAGGLN